MIIRNSKFKQVIPDNFTYKGTKYTKAYHKGEILFAYTDDDYAYQYFTIESLEDGNVITLTIGSGVTSTQMTSFSYSVDNGSTWNTTTVDSTTQTINVSLDKGEKAIWKGVGKQLASGFITNGNSYCSIFSSTKNYAIYGNLASLIDDTNFASITESTGNLTFCGLFYNSSKLIDCDNLVIPFTKYKYGDLSDTFSGTSIVNSPHITVNSVVGNFALMRCFIGCSNLENIENLKLLATNLGYTSVYNSMFSSCTSLTTAPELPATTLGQYCYNSMFYGCTSLTKAPELLATTLVNSCYREMFSGCTNLNYIKCLATNISATDCTTGWVNNVASTGTFIKADTMNDWTIDSVNGIPIGWTLHNYENCTVILTVNDSSYGRVDGAGTYKTGELVTIKANAIDGYRFVGWYDGSTLVSENEAYTFQIWTDVSYQAVFESGQVDYSTQYFTLESLEDENTFQIYHGQYANAPITIEYSLNNGSTWTSKTYQTNTGFAVQLNLNKGDKVLVKSSNIGFNTSSVTFLGNANSFFGNKAFKVYGNVMSLIYGDDFANQTTIPYSGALAGLFITSENLNDASNLVLPATNVSAYCYYCMFYGCSSLKKGPSLPATSLGNCCYQGMFAYCKSLTEAPALPSGGMKLGCYNTMFKGCTSLVTPPALPAENLRDADGCYKGMFYGCTSLVTAPELPATILSIGCYQAMFENCTSLTTAPTLPSETTLDFCYKAMFWNCSKIVGTFSLPALTIGEKSYDKMFTGTKITTIKVYAPSSSWEIDFGSSLPSSGTYYVKRNATGNITVALPSGWRISKTL